MSSPVQLDLHLPTFTLESGATLATHRVRVWAWGPASEREAWELIGQGSPSTLGDDVPTVLIVHALTGDARAGGPGGWWEPLIGPGRALDPARLRIVCCNNLGSCYGTSGPDDADFPSRAAERSPPPQTLEGRGAFVLDDALPASVTTWDQARSLSEVLKRLGIGELALVTGGSIGGMIALCLDRLLPGRIETLLPIAAAAAASPWIIAWNHVGRQTLVHHGLRGPEARRGLELARQLAMVTYRAEPGLEQRHGRSLVDGGAWQPRVPYSVQTYLEHQGRKLADRFTPAAYFVQLGAMDHHDMARPAPPEATWTPGRLGIQQQRVLSVGISTDTLYLPHHAQQIALDAAQAGRPAAYRELVSPHGHDAFLIEWDALDVLFRDVVSSLPQAARSGPQPPP